LVKVFARIIVLKLEGLSVHAIATVELQGIFS
jgi:hypothetical protein